jgi:ribosome maturation factor RimP
VGLRPLFLCMTAPSANRESVIAQITEIAERVGAAEGIEIVDVELKGSGNNRFLRISIDKPSGVTHAECEFISKNVGTILDVEDVVSGGGYSLQVSSPGVDRPLRKPRDFKRYIGKKVKVLLREPVADRRRWEGTLAGLLDGIITIEPASGEPVRFDIGNVEKANLKFDW